MNNYKLTDQLRVLIATFFYKIQLKIGKNYYLHYSHRRTHTLKHTHKSRNARFTKSGRRKYRNNYIKFMSTLKHSVKNTTKLRGKKIINITEKIIS